MQSQFSISVFLDTRRIKKSGLYPVKLRVYSNIYKRTKYYPTVFELTETQFKSIWETTKPRTEHKELRDKIQAVEVKAKEIANDFSPFSFEQFEKRLFRKSGDGENVFYQYSLVIEKLKNNKQIGTASNYSLSLKSIKAFILFTKGKEAQRLLFIEITKVWLEKYEQYMLDDKKRSRTTVSMYLRALRTVFNIAIDAKEIDKGIYPFGEGKDKYIIPSVKNVKKALSKIQLKQLFDAKPKTLEQEKAKDFWFFSYACSGMNIKDVALLKYENLQENKLYFLRAKTINTKRNDLKYITIYLNEYSSSIIEKYGNPDKSSRNYIFPILSDNLDEQQKHDKVKNFTRFINQNLKKLTKSIGLTEEISSYWARHSFATNSIRNGASMEFVSEALNHSNQKTTQLYFAGFDDEAKEEFMQKIMNF